MKFTFVLVLLLFCSYYSGNCQSKKYIFNVQEGATRLLDSAETGGMLKALDGFLRVKNNYTVINEYVDTAYIKKNFYPFYWFLDIENNAGLKDSAFYKPSLLAVVPVEKEQYLIKLSYIGNPPGGGNIHSMSYALIAKKSPKSYYFYNSVDYNTRNWNNKVVGSVTYIYPNQLDLKKAQEMDSFNRSFAKKFDLDVIPLTYYRCDDPEQVFRIIGCDYIANMYFSTSGGLAEQWHNTLYAGNNSELYPHEVVHFYTSKTFKGSKFNRIVDEGYATYIGGSGGKSLKELALETKEYLSKNPEMDITKMFIDNFRFKSGVPFRYVASGLICQEIELTKGLPAVKKFFAGDSSIDTFFIQLDAVTGTKRTGFPGYMRKLIANSAKFPVTTSDRLFN